MAQGPGEGLGGPSNRDTVERGERRHVEIESAVVLGIFERGIGQVLGQVLGQRAVEACAERFEGSAERQVTWLSGDGEGLDLPSPGSVKQILHVVVLGQRAPPVGLLARQENHTELGSPGAKCVVPEQVPHQVEAGLGVVHHHQAGRYALEQRARVGLVAIAHGGEKPGEPALVTKTLAPLDHQPGLARASFAGDEPHPSRGVLGVTPRGELFEQRVASRFLEGHHLVGRAQHLARIGSEVRSRTRRWLENRPETLEIRIDLAQTGGDGSGGPARELGTEAREDLAEIPGGLASSQRILVARQGEDLGDQRVEEVLGGQRRGVVPRCEAGGDLPTDAGEVRCLEVPLDRVEKRFPTGVVGVEPGEGLGDLLGATPRAFEGQQPVERGDDLGTLLGITPRRENVDLEIAGALSPPLGGGGEDEPSVLPRFLQLAIRDRKSAQTVEHHPIAKVGGVGQGLDLLARTDAAE